MLKKITPLIIGLLILFSPASIAQNNAPANSSDGKQDATSDKTPDNQPADAQSDGKKNDESQAKTTTSEPEPEVKVDEDPAVKITVTPVVVGHLIDRVLEPGEVRIEAPGALSAEVYIVPVDAPYGGKPTGKGRMIGKDSNPRDGLVIPWTTSEPYLYVKVFAVVRKKDAPEKPVRSHTLDIGIGSSRYKATPAKP